MSDDLRDRIAAALRHEGGDPDDPQIASELADAVMAVVEPELEALRAERDRYRTAWTSARRGRAEAMTDAS